MREVVIVSAARTAIGSFLGSLAAVTAPKLGSYAIRGAISRAGIDGSEIGTVHMGSVLQAGQGQAPGRQAAIYAGIPNSVPSVTINKVCGSGLEAVVAAARAILLGETEIALAGGLESMSNSPHLLRNSRTGTKMGPLETVDSMVFDGLWDPYSNQHMGMCGELCAKEKGFTVKVGRFPFMANGKAIAMGETEGMVKTVFDAKTGELLGAHMIGAEVTEMIQGYTIAKSLETTEADLMHVVFPHPTLSDMMHESVLDAYGKAVHI